MQMISQVKQMNQRQLLLLAAGAVAMVVLGVFVGMAVTGGIGSQSAVTDRIALHYTDVTVDQMPLTSVEAEAAGWDGSIRCILGKGRYYKKESEDGPYPILLLYNREDQLIGMRVFSTTQQPTPPWQHEPEGIQSTEIANMEFEQWITGIYLIEPSKSCGVVSRQVCPTCYG